MNDNLRISREGVDLIKSFEGFFSRAYYCPAGVLTIGYGHTNLSGVAPKVVVGMTITKDEATRILADVLGKVYEPAVKKLVKVRLTQSQYDALVSFVYNCGEANLAKSSLLRKLNTGMYNAVPEELMKWNKGGGKVLNGLTRRREAEGAMWRSTKPTHPVENTEPLPQVIDPPAPSPVPTPEPAPAPVQPTPVAPSVFEAVLKFILALFNRKG